MVIFASNSNCIDDSNNSQAPGEALLVLRKSSVKRVYPEGWGGLICRVIAAISGLRGLLRSLIGKPFPLGG